MPGQTRCPGCLQGKPRWCVQHVSNTVPALAIPVIPVLPTPGVVPALASPALLGPAMSGAPAPSAAKGPTTPVVFLCPTAEGGCGSVVGAASKKCTHCGFEFAQPARAPGTGKKLCPMCAAAVGITTNKCNDCGHVFKPARALGALAPGQKRCGFSKPRQCANLQLAAQHALHRVPRPVVVIEVLAGSLLGQLVNIF